MEGVKTDSETKSQLVTEICNISKNATPPSSCAHRRRRDGQNPVNSLFVDWYLVLRVHENADIEIIRKRYLSLALLLHPDKNNHPKAEFAFKLVYEAYICLSDKAKRKAFDLERRKIVCTECINNDSNLAFTSSCTKTTSKGVFSSKKCQKKNQILQRIKDLRIKLGKEATVIEDCLRAYAPPRRSFCSDTKTEYPVFNPVDLGATCCKKATHESYLGMQSKKISTS